MSQLQRDELDGILFSPTPSTNNTNKIPKPINSQQRAASYSPNLRKKAVNPFGTKSNERTQEDLTGLIEEIPFPQDDLSITSFSHSSNSNNTPQKFGQTIDNSSAHALVNFGGISEKKPPTTQPNAKSVPRQALQFSSGHRGQALQNSAGVTRPLHLNFENSLIPEEMTGMESLTPSQMKKWTDKFVTPGDSKSIFPVVTGVGSIDVSGEHSHSKFREGDMSRMSVNDNQNTIVDIDNIHEREVSTSHHKGRGVDSLRQSIEESRAKIQLKIIEEQKKKLEHDLNVQKKIYTKLEQENIALSQKIGEVTEHLELIKGKYADKSTLQELRGAGLENARMQVKQLKGVIEKKDAKINELTAIIDNLQRNEKAYTEAAEAQIENLHLEIERYKIFAQSHANKLNETEAKYREHYERLAGEIRSRDARIEDLTRQLNEHSNQIARLQNEIHGRQMKIDGLTTTLQEHAKLLEEAIHSSEQKEAEIERLKKQLETIRTDQYNINNLQVDKTWENKYYELEEQMNTKLQHSKAQIIKLNEIIAQQKEQLANMHDNMMANPIDISHTFSKTNGSFNKFSTGAFENLLPPEELNTSRPAITREEEINQIKETYENQISIYTTQIKELEQKIQQLESALNQRNTQGTESQRGSVTTNPQKTDRVTVSQATTYLDPLYQLMVDFNIYDPTCSSYDENLKKLKEHIQNLTDSTEKLHAEVMEYKKTFINLNSENHYLRIENEQLKEESSEAREKETEKNKKITALHNEITDLKRTIVGLESQLKAGNRSIRNSPSKEANESKIHDPESNEYYHKYNQLEQEHQNLQEEYRVCQENYNKLKTDHYNVETELKRAQFALQKAKDDIELLNLQLQTQQGAGEKSHFDEIKKTLNERIKNLEAKNEEFMRELTEKDYKIAELSEHLTIAKTEKEHLLKDANATQEALKKSLSEKIQSLEKRNKELIEDMKFKNTELEEIRIRFQDLLIKYEDEKSQREKLMANKEFKISSQSELVKQLEEENVKALKEINALKEKLESKALELNKLATEKNTLALEKERLTILFQQEKGSTLQAYQQEVEDLKKDIAELNEEVTRLRSLRGQLEEKDIENQKKIAQLTSSLKQKETELKHIVEGARKKEESEAQVSAELNNKSKELEKLKSLHSQMEKNLETIKEERNTLKKKVDELEKAAKKTQEELKQKEEQLKQLEEKDQKNIQYLREKDKKNVELFNVNKSLQEQLKNLEETLNNLKKEHEKQTKTLVQKNADHKALQQTNKKLEEKNNELSNEIMDLNIKLQKMEHELSTIQLQTTLKSTNPSDESYIEKETAKEEKLREQELENKRLREEAAQLEQTRRDFEALLADFAQKEAEFEKIKNSFVQKFMSQNEKIATLEKKNNALLEETKFLNTQLTLQQNNNELLKEQVKTLETSLRNIPLHTDSDSENMPPEDHVHTFASRITEKGFRALKENYDEMNRHHDIDELRPPYDYDPNPLKLTNQTFKSSASFNPKVTNVFHKNILDVISPEMLSIDDTVTLMVEVMRRASQSAKLAQILSNNEEFKNLTRSIKRYSEYAESEYAYDSVSTTTSGQVRKQYRFSTDLELKRSSRNIEGMVRRTAEDIT